MVADNALEIAWYGQSMFTISGGGTTVACDPTPPETGYSHPPVPADIVLRSHEHFDHAYIAGIIGDPRIVSASGPHEFGGLRITGFETYHDSSGGSERGPNLVFRWEQAAITLAHLGDLGEMPGPGLVSELTGLDIAMIPVGGVFTIDGAQAARLVTDLAPRVVLPMHYGTPDCKVGVKPLDEFVNSVAAPVRQIGERPLTVLRGGLPEATEVWVVPYQ